MSAKRNLLIGVGIGAVLGILYAPHKGTKTRKLIAKRGCELRDGWDNLKETVGNVFDKGEQSTDEFLSEGSATSTYTNASIQDQWEM
jgi:gas vesicle protein